MTENNLERYIRWYEKKGDNLVGELILKNMNASDLRSLFEVPKEDYLMYDCYPIETKKQLEFLQKQIDEKIDLDIYDYFLEAQSI